MQAMTDGGKVLEAWAACAGLIRHFNSGVDWAGIHMQGMVLGWNKAH